MTGCGPSRSGRLSPRRRHGDRIAPVSGRAARHRHRHAQVPVVFRNGREDDREPDWSRIRGGRVDATVGQYCPHPALQQGALVTPAMRGGAAPCAALSPAGARSRPRATGPCAAGAPVSEHRPGRSSSGRRRSPCTTGRGPGARPYPSPAEVRRATTTPIRRFEHDRRPGLSAAQDFAQARRVVWDVAVEQLVETFVHHNHLRAPTVDVQSYTTSADLLLG